jgi:hypothetical protein
MVPAADEPRLVPLIGHRVEFHALHYLESHGQGSSFVPRLIGFGSTEERAFFELLTTVKGLGMRKALRALRLPYQAVARAIAAEDLEVLTSLPEIGRRTAQTMVAELGGKVDRFLELKPDESAETAERDSRSWFAMPWPCSCSWASRSRRPGCSSSRSWPRTPTCRPRTILSRRHIV